jgi:threonine/homoserine/homoserine lactone efflux protein
MNSTLSLLGIAAAIGAGAISPGPSFVMVARTAVGSRAGGLAAALGMGIGGLAFAVAALAGLQALLSAVPGFYIGLKLLGGCYLAFLGVQIWRGARRPLDIANMTDPPGAARAGRAFLLGAGTQVSNPKTAIVYASVFAAFLPDDVPLALALAIPAVVFAIEAGWYSIVALALSAPAPRAVYLRYKPRIDMTAGGVMVLLGAKLIVASGR